MAKKPAKPTLKEIRALLKKLLAEEDGGGIMEETYQQAKELLRRLGRK